MKINSTLIAVAAVGALAAGPLSAHAAQSGKTTTATKPSDTALDDRIEARLKADTTLKPYDLSVSVDKGLVTLKGTVATEAQKLRAASVSKVTGVTRVDNQITVDKDVHPSMHSDVKDAAVKTKDATAAAADKTKNGVETAAEKTKDATKTAADKTKNGAETAAEKTKDATKTAADKTKNGAETAGEKSKNALSKTGEVITDAWITTKLKADFVNEDTLKGSSINVDTNDHVVTLKGTVKTPAGKQRAVQIAKTTEGVKNVVDQLVIGSK